MLVLRSPFWFRLTSGQGRILWFLLSSSSYWFQVARESVFLTEFKFASKTLIDGTLVGNLMVVGFYLGHVNKKFGNTLRASLYDIPLYARFLIRQFTAPLYDGKVVPLHSHSFALQLHQIKFSKDLLWKIICISRNKT